MDFSTQGLINSGAAWTLEGSIGRECMASIESGYAILGIEGHHDYWHNYVPSRYEVKTGTKGSVQYANALRKARGDRPLRATDFDAGLGDNHAEYESDYYTEDEDND